MMLSVEWANKYLLALLTLYFAFVGGCGAFLQVFITICRRAAGDAGISPLSTTIGKRSCFSKSYRQDNDRQ
ncbi:UNVERIFIED_ORG: hypothetical protein M2193_004949 [Bradyrhizobium japonicum]|uniref:hypothetical protein n=1 Tax=Bradyrhizobium diazoefficiens TaxID=1355477 RepID=UPI00346A66DA